MKSLILSAATWLIASLTSLQAQTANIWRGGFPGHETNWNHARNWSLGRIPDFFDWVIIPDVSTSTRRYPIISSGEVQVQTLEIKPGATLTLHTAARVFAEEFICNGTCKGCEWRIMIEGTVPPITASRQ